MRLRLRSRKGSPGPHWFLLMNMTLLNILTSLIIIMLNLFIDFRKHVAWSEWKPLRLNLRLSYVMLKMWDLLSCCECLIFGTFPLYPLSLKVGDDVGVDNRCWFE